MEVLTTRFVESLPRSLTCFMTEEAGTSPIEIALVGLLAAVVCILALLALGKST